ncbi:hypothetical protein [Chitinivibrio alkaliphilus]|uniref:Uncharacterized protein n=1 Tax=Chitinivibrio alkaliphilus ACht1 TaxID=1313304 RepID=U7D4X0_9BACT|nr:hypothetical protein [Chitinivibrio alkaliphilus]ERP31564.1 hypothetical protein CALK_1427 [Chitinivibrio alkaliphilus ACht1]
MRKKGFYEKITPSIFCILISFGAGLYSGRFFASVEHPASPDTTSKKLFLALQSMEYHIAREENLLHETMERVIYAMGQNRDFMLSYFAENRPAARVIRQSATYYGELFPALFSLLVVDSSGLILSSFNTDTLPADTTTTSFRTSSETPPRILFHHRTVLQEKEKDLRLYGTGVYPLSRLTSLAEQYGVEVLLIHRSENHDTPIFHTLSEDISRFGDDGDDTVIINSNYHRAKSTQILDNTYLYVLEEEKEQTL